MGAYLQSIAEYKLERQLLIMNNDSSHSEKAGTQPSWLRKRIVPLLMLILVIAITVGLFIFAQRYPEKVEAFGNLGYLGVFIASLVSSLTVILPVPGILVVLPLVTNLNPFLVALAGSTGGIIGEITGYTAGYSGQGIVNKGRMYERVERWMKRWGIWTVFAFAFVPFLPFDIAGVVAGVLRYPLWKFLIVGWIGKTVKFIILVLTAFWGWEFLLRYIS